MDELDKILVPKLDAWYAAKEKQQQPKPKPKRRKLPRNYPCTEAEAEGYFDFDPNKKNYNLMVGDYLDGPGSGAVPLWQAPGMFPTARKQDIMMMQMQPVMPGGRRI